MMKFAEEDWEEFLAGVRDGVDVVAACWGAGLNPRDVIEYISIGQQVVQGALRASKGREEAVSAYKAYARARAHMIRVMTRSIKAAAQDGEWRAAELWLKKQHANAWGQFAGMDESELPQIEGGAR